MAHSEKRTNPFREAQLALLTGTIYGGTHTISGHPLDTIKSKMQIQTGFTNEGMVSVSRKIWQTEGMRGFFKGVIPPLWGSMVYRAIMMSAYEYGYTYCENNLAADHFMKQELIWGLRPMVPAAAAFSASIRSIFESPIEYAKVMGQTNQKWVLKDCYRGVQWQVLRTTGLLVFIFGTLDMFRRKTEVLKTVTGNFLVTCGASAGSYVICWPLETLKNLAQAGAPFPGASVGERIKFLGGVRGLSRGILPGTICGGFRNGCGMVAMIYAQRLATHLGLRNST